MKKLINFSFICFGREDLFRKKGDENPKGLNTLAYSNG